MPTPERTTERTIRSKRSRRRSGLAAAFVALLAAAAIATAGCGAGSSGSSPAGAETFGFLDASPPPRAWQESRLPDGSATLAYPSGWKAIRSDPGTVTAALRSPSGEIRGYLNATPQQGGETLSNWGHFRTDHNRDEGDVDIRTLASSRGLHFRGGRGSCVIDTYASSTGHAYREIACIVNGTSATTVVVGAAPPGQWRQQGPAIERAMSSFLT